MVQVGPYAMYQAFRRADMHNNIVNVGSRGIEIGSRKYPIY